MLGLIMIVGAIGTSTYYWLSRGRYEDFIVGRFKTTFVLFFWYLYLVYLVINRIRISAREAKTEEAKKRILG